jgi:sn-glycerol 3-phosphate transport system substrate-binding protein
MVISACGASSPQLGKEQVEVVFWHTQTGVNAEVLQQMVDSFNANAGKDKKISVKSEYQGNYTQLYQKILAAIQANTPPDMAVAYESQIADYMKAKAVVEFDAWVKALDKKTMDDIFPGYIETNKFPAYDNKMLSFPFTKSVAVMYTNEDALKAAGVRVPTAAQAWTVAEFEDACKKVTKKDAAGKTTVYCLALTTDASYFDMAVYALGGKVLKDDNKGVVFNEGAGLQWMELIDRLVKGGYAYLPQGYDWQNDFANGKVVLSFQSSTGVPFIRDIMTDKGKKAEPFKWSLLLPPQADPAKPKTVMFGANVTVFKTTALKQAAAWEFIKWFTDAPQTVKWSIASSYMPIRKSAATTADLKASWDKNPQAKNAFDLIGVSYPEPNVPGWQDTRNYLADAMTAVISGKSAAKAAIDEAATKANKIITESQ